MLTPRGRTPVGIEPIINILLYKLYVVAKIKNKKKRTNAWAM